MENQNPRADAFAAIALLILVVPFIATLHKIYIDPFDPGFGARDFPIGVLAAIVILAAVMLVRALRELRRQAIPLVDGEALSSLVRYLGPAVAIGLGYIWLFTLVQYLVPTALALSLAMALFGNRGWVRLGLVPVVTAISFYLFFFILLGLHELPGTLIRYDGKSFLSF